MLRFFNVPYATYHCHIRLDSAQRATSRDAAQVLPESARIQRIPELEQARQPLQSAVVEAIQIGQVARLVDLIDVGLLGREVDVLPDLIADVAEKLVIDEVLDDSVLVAMPLSVKGKVSCAAEEGQSQKPKRLEESRMR